MNNVIRVVFTPIKFKETDQNVVQDVFTPGLMSRSEYKDILIQGGCSEFEVAYELKQMEEFLA